MPTLTFNHAKLHHALLYLVDWLLAQPPGNVTVNSVAVYQREDGNWETSVTYTRNNSGE